MTCYPFRRRSVEEFSFHPRGDLGSLFGVGVSCEFCVEDQRSELGQLTLKEIVVVLCRLQTIASRPDSRVTGKCEFDDGFGGEDVCGCLRG